MEKVRELAFQRARTESGARAMQTPIRPALHSVFIVLAEILENLGEDRIAGLRRHRRVVSELWPASERLDCLADAGIVRWCGTIRAYQRAPCN